MPDNQTYIQKADLALSDLTSGGLLVAEQVKEFFEIVIEESVLLPLVTTVPMSGPTWEMPKMGFTGEVLRPKQATALGEADRSKPELAKVSLASKPFIAEARIPYEVVEDNVANGSFPQTALTLLGKAVARDLEKLIIQGDTTSSSLLLASLDGVLKLATTSVVNAGGVRLSKSVLKIILQTLSSQFMTTKHAFITSKNAMIDYNDTVANRQTPKGDDALVKAASGEYGGHGMIMVPLFPENLGAGTNKTNVLFTDPKNIHVGMQRDVRIETSRDISKQEFIIVASLRADVNYAHEPAVVKATEVLASAG